MKAHRFFLTVIILSGILLGACAGAPSSQSAPGTSAGGDKPVSEVVFTGTIESMNGDQWVINGQPVTVESSVLQDGPFMIGDSVKVEARVAGDGTVTAQRVESPSAVDLAGSLTVTPDASSAGTPAVAGSSSEATGPVEAITDTTITLGGQTFPLAPGAEIKDIITVGMIVKLHFITNADGSRSVREVEIASPDQLGNSNDDNSNSTNANDNSSSDDNGNSSNSNDDQGNDDSSNDNNAGDDNGNDDNGGNSNDDSSGNSNADG